jgi:hypothetical protein
MGSVPLNEVTAKPMSAAKACPAASARAQDKASTAAMFRQAVPFIAFPRAKWVRAREARQRSPIRAGIAGARPKSGHLQGSILNANLAQLCTSLNLEFHGVLGIERFDRPRLDCGHVPTRRERGREAAGSSGWGLVQAYRGATVRGSSYEAGATDH